MEDDEQDVGGVPLVERVKEACVTGLQMSWQHRAVFMFVAATVGIHYYGEMASI